MIIRPRRHVAAATTALLLALASVPALAAPELRLGTAAGAPGSLAGLPLAVVSDPSVTAFQVDLLFDPASLTAEAVLPGSALVASGHELRGHSPEAGRYRLIVFSRSNAALPAGVAALVQFRVAPSAALGELPVAIDAPEIVDTTASVVAPTATADGSISVGACLGGDVFPEGAGDASVDLADFLHAARAISGAGALDPRFVSCADLAPGTFACEESAPFGRCPEPDGVFDTADLSALRALAGGAWTISCADCPVPGTAPPGPSSPGEMNDDGVINVTDVIQVLRFAVALDAPTARQLVSADVAPAEVVGSTSVAAGDGRINVSDVLLILRTAVGLTALAWPEGALEVRLSSPADYVAWSLTLTGVPAGLEPFAFEGPDCAVDLSGVDAALTTWAVTCVTDPVERQGANGLVGLLRYRGPASLNPAELTLSSSLAAADLGLQAGLLSVSAP